jgi:plastocyanin
MNNEFINQHKKNIILLIILVLILIGISSAIFIFNKKAPESSLNTSQNQNQTENKSQTWQSVPSNAVVSDENVTSVPENVARPKDVSPASAISNASLRDFPTIVAENDKFSPDTITAYKGDIINFYIRAVDKNYDFSQPEYGYDGHNPNNVIKKGETKKFQVQVTAQGKFLFYCASCGGPNKGPKGYLIVIPKK